MEENIKSIPVEVLETTVKINLNTALNALNNFKEDVQKKETTIIEKSERLKNIIKILNEEKSIKINDKMVEEFQKSEDNYKQITKILSQEVDVHLGFYSRYISEETPKEIAVHKDESGTFGDYITKSTKLIKNFIKKRQREINVIFSRYENGFNNQLRRLGTVEAYFKSQKKN